METLPTLGRSFRFSRFYVKKKCLSYPLAVSPSVATIYFEMRGEGRAITLAMAGKRSLLTPLELRPHFGHEILGSSSYK